MATKPTYEYESSQVRELGHPGRYYEAVAVTNATASFTASMFGYGAILVAGLATTGTATLTGGGEINLAGLAVAGPIDLSIEKVHCTGTVYVLKRQGM